MLKNLFKKNKEVEVVAPMAGEAIDIEKIPDVAFSGKMLGDGIGFEPTDGIIVSPVKGEIVALFPTKHAYGIKTDEGIELLLHIGIDTVQMNGDGFETFVEVGTKVNAGDKLGSFDLDLVKEKAVSHISAIIITNSADLSEINKSVGSAKAGETVVMTVKK